MACKILVRFNFCRAGNNLMNNIEQEYWKQVAAMSGQERVARSLSLFEDITTMIAHKIHRANSKIQGRELNRLIAMQLYRRDQAIQSLLGPSQTNEPV